MQSSHLRFPDMIPVFIYLLASALYTDDAPHIKFHLNTGNIQTLGKLAYQDGVVYEVLLDKFGRPCPTGRFAELKKGGLGGGIESNRDLVSISIVPPTPGFYQFCSGRLVHYTLISGEGVGRIYAPDTRKKIISIDDYLQSDEVYPRSVHSYREVFGKRPAGAPKHQNLFLLPGRLTAFKGLESKAESTSYYSVYPKQPPAFIEKKPANAQEQQFAPDYNQRFSIRFHQLIYVVTIDIVSGEYRFEDFAKKLDANTKPRPELPPWLMKPMIADESVYELKHSRLIPGFIHQIGDEEWIFIPDLGGIIIEADDYLKTYQPWSRRIYNLPGKFVPKK